MTIKTKFNEGDKVFTIDTGSLKVKNFTVEKIITYTTKGYTSVTLYDGDTFNANGYNENKCFSTEAELMTFITTKDNVEAL